ncbi:Sec23-binding domain of Sec16-domain-containing protein [Mortierella sp. GBAus27b]|nr:Sec23-binding domain of Sec16-domain-containing protein [Mortierella sp. GBAus27b]
MAQPNRYYQQQQHQQHQQRPSAEEGPIPFFAGAGNPPRPAPLQHQTRPAFVYQQPQPQQRPPLQQQQQQPPRPPQFQRHPQQHPRPPPQPPVQQHNRPHPLAQQHQRPPPAPTSQPSNTELAPAANLFANPPVAITQSPNRPPRPQGYQASTSNDFVQQDESTQSSRQGSHAQQPRPPVQRQGQPLQRHPHHPVPAIQPASNEATAFGSTADLFGGPGHPSPISNTSAPLLQQGPAPVPGGSRPSSRPPLPMGSLQKRPSLTPSQQPASTPPPPQQRPILSNRQQQSPLPAQAQRFSPSPYGVQQQPATPYQQPSTSSPRLHRLGSVSSVHSGSPHTTHVLPKTPLMSAVQPSPLPQGQPSTPSFPPTSYTGGQESPRVSTPQVILQPCPFSECSGENKPQAKFCSECGRPISLASQSATPMLGPRTEHPSVQASPMPSQDHTHSFSQEYGQYQPQTAQHQEYYNNGGYDYQHQQQQQYDPSTENYSENYLQPQDQSAPEQQPQVTEPERINDPLNRHLGCPLIAFGFGGKVTTWFAQGNGALGPLKMQRISDVIPKDTAIASYPGPLLMDSSVQLMAKRNHVMKFVEDKINEFSQSPDGHVHDAHRVLVWKLLKVMLEQEGTLTGGTRIDEAVRGVLRSIPLTNLPQEAVQQKTSEQETASTDALQELLRQGDLAASIRYAIDSRLWAHALVLSSHGDRELWNEAVSGFMNQELSAASGHANGRESMRVLYTLLSGQSERAVSQLVPQNLRTQYLETKDDLSKRVEIPDQSLTQWRDTLILILSNRTEGDQGTINALGNLLRKEGWVEAAHICYLLSPQVSVHSGSDDSNSSMVLLGVENDPHAAYPFYGNVSAFQKTEIYEFGRALKSSGATGGLPFFQAYKLIYSWRLLDVGMLSEAARYLESMENIMKSQTKGSPYYNSTLFAQLKELTERMAASVHNAGYVKSSCIASGYPGYLFTSYITLAL